MQHSLSCYRGGAKRARSLARGPVCRLRAFKTCKWCLLTAELSLILLEFWREKKTNIRCCDMRVVHEFNSATRRRDATWRRRGDPPISEIDRSPTIAYCNACWMGLKNEFFPPLSSTIFSHHAGYILIAKKLPVRRSSSYRAPLSDILFFIKSSLVICIIYNYINQIA